MQYICSMRLFHRCTIFFLLLFSQNNLFSQTYELKKYGVDEGLPSSSIARVFNDSKGFLWVMTDKGASRFDGKRFRNFTVADGLPINYIFAAGEDRHQRIWFHTPLRHFCYFDLKDNHFRRSPNTLDTIRPGFMTYIFDNADETMTFYTNARMVYTLDKNLKMIDKRPQNPLETIIQKDYPKVGSEQVIYSRKTVKDTLHSLASKQNLPAEMVTFPTSYATSITLSDSALMYRKGLNIVSQYNGKTYEKKITDLINNKSDFDIRIHNTGKPNLRMIRTLKEAFVIDAQLNRVKEFDFISEYDINTLYIDKFNNAWLCTNRQGLIMKRMPLVKKMPITILNNNIPVSHITVNPKGEIYIGNAQGDIYNYRNGLVNKLDWAGLPKLSFQTFHFDKKGNLFVSWRSQPHGIISSSVLNSNRKVTVRYNESLKDKSITDKNGDKTIGLTFNASFVEIVNHNDVRTVCENNSGKLYYISGDELRLAETSDTGWTTQKLLKFKVFNLTCDKDDVIWGVRHNGLFQYRQNQFDSLPNLRKLYPKLGEQMLLITADKKNGLWIVAEEPYTMYLNSKTQFFSEIPELKKEFVSHLQVDDKNRVWFSTNNGVCMVDIMSETPFKYRFLRINRASGLPTQDILTTAVYNDTLYVGSPKGMTIMPLNTVLEKRTDSTLYQPMVIANIKINGKDTILRGSYTLAYNENNIDIDFSCISFNNDDALQYEYRMLQKGSIDTLWRKSEDASLDFSYLPAGAYTLEIRALYDNEVISSLSEPLSFNIRQAFWKTPWFILPLLALIMAGIYAYFRYNIKQIERKEREKSIVSKQMANLEMQALQAQMNPHFVFNALTAIQNFIWTQDIKNANAYLTRFTKLMRQFLESSREKFVTLEEEMALIYNYVELEQMRFPNKFDAEYHLDEELDKSTEIPSALIQPFVENAIKHGLLHKKEKGRLIVSFSKKNELIECVIDDDGVGRDEAAARQRLSQKTHRSQATKMLDEKISLLRKTVDIDVQIETIDKKQADGTAAGTKVVITVLTKSD
jgi:ligand-binding sensor domain-containing protein/two-component sensor histidine kinase